MKKTLGYLFMVVSFALWGIILALPFTGVSALEMVSLTTALAIASELAFLVAIALLGKQVWGQFKALFRRRK